MHRYHHASGVDLFDCAFLAEDATHTRVVGLRRAAPGSATPLDVGVRLACDTPLTGLWRSATGQVWATDPRGTLWHTRGLWGAHAGRWTQHTLDLVPDGVAGLADDAVFVWGRRPSDGTCLVRGWDGEALKPFPSPGFAVRALHVGGGLIAVGDGGRAAVLDGPAWRVVATGSDAPGRSVHAADGTIVIGTESGEVLRGDLGGFEVVGTLPGPVRAVAVWRGAVWAGAGAHGLYRDGTQVRDDRPCNRLEAHGALLIGCDDVVCHTLDGEAFPAAGRGLVDQLVGA